MTEQEYAFVEGWVKRASEYGLSYNEAIQLLKSAAPGLPAVKPAVKPVAKPMVTPAMQNERMSQPGQRAFNQDPRTGRPLTPAQMAAAND